ncbi:MAG: DUF1236 domain-containing protein [Tardiphaga sp.]
MNKRLLMSVAAAALIAGMGFANAQGAGGAGRESGGAGAAGGAAHSAPAGGAGSAGGAADRAAPGGAGDRAAGGAAGGAGERAAQTDRNAPATKDEATDTTNRSDQRQDQKAQSDDKMQRDNSRNATDSTRDNAKGGKDAKAEGNKAEGNKAEGNNADSKNPNAKSAADDKGMNKQTTGQAGAGAKLSSEQRTKVTTVIKQQNIKPVTNVNFSISIGTRVPRDVEFHPLPAEIVTVYPDWRGYDFILVNDQILVINPRSYEIVAVIDA